MQTGEGARIGIYGFVIGAWLTVWGMGGALTGALLASRFTDHPQLEGLEGFGDIGISAMVLDSLNTVISIGVWMIVFGILIAAISAIYYGSERFGTAAPVG